ncbi:hypothetical protein [Pseudanabaena minima]|uniref:hypothetical protein n=1 Tax=Pseudanabaena minima TaxID=890415 RepID=UPI003DA9DE3E
MKKFVTLSVLLSAVSAGMLSAAPSSAQTVPIISGTVNLNLDSFSTILNLSSSTVLTPIGSVSINADGFNGDLTSSVLSITDAVTSSVPSNVSNEGNNLNINWDYSSNNGPNPLIFVGTTNGTGPNGTFTNAPTTINFSAEITRSTAVAGIFPAPVSGGSITLPAPPPPVVVVPPVVVPPVVVPPVVTCTDCLNVIPDLRISNSTFLSPASQQPEYSQEYSRNNFSTSSFDGGRVLGLENK